METLWLPRFQGFLNDGFQGRAIGASEAQGFGCFYKKISLNICHEHRNGGLFLQMRLSQKPGGKFARRTLRRKIDRVKWVLRTPTVRQFDHTFCPVAGTYANAHKPGRGKFPEKEQAHFPRGIGAAEEIGLGQDELRMWCLGFGLVLDFVNRRDAETRRVNFKILCASASRRLTPINFLHLPVVFLFQKTPSETPPHIFEGIVVFLKTQAKAKTQTALTRHVGFGTLIDF